MTNPQTWNGYAYVGNSPLSFTDSTGMFLEATAVGASTGGPFGAIIGAAIDIGGLLGGLFGFGGGPPPLANFPFPNQVPTATPSGGFGDPDGQSGNGALFGGGNVSPFVFSLDSTGPAAEPCSLGEIIDGHECGVASEAGLIFFRRATLTAGIGWSAAIRYIGWRGEKIVGALIKLPKNTDLIIRNTASARSRIPDFVNEGQRILYEVKNSSYVSYSAQIRDIALWAKQQPQQYTFQVYVNASATLSPRLLQAQQQGLVTIKTFKFP